MKIRIQRAHTRHADTTRHEVILPGLALTKTSHELSGILARTRDLLKLTDEKIKHRVRRYKGQPRTVFISGRTVSDKQASVDMDEPELQTRVSEEWAYIPHPPRCRHHTQLLRNTTSTELDTESAPDKTSAEHNGQSAQTAARGVPTPKTPRDNKGGYTTELMEAEQRTGDLLVFTLNITGLTAVKLHHVLHHIRRNAVDVMVLIDAQLTFQQGKWMGRIAKEQLGTGTVTHIR